MTLSATDLARLEAASRILLSPLAAPSPEAWLREAGGAVRDLVGGSGVVLQHPTSPVPYFSDDAPEVSEGVLDYLKEVRWDGVRFSDPVVDVWNRLRRQSRLDAFGWDINMQMVERQGLDPEDSPIIMDVLRGHRFNDFTGMVGETPEGESMIWVLQHSRGGFRHGEGSVPLLNALMPAYRSGLDALTRFAAHRTALDAVSEPLVAFDVDGRELHRNRALARLLAEDPAGTDVETALRRLGAGLRRTALAPPGYGLPPPPAEAEVSTSHGRYTLRPTALPPGLFGSDPAVLVSVLAEVAPALPCAQDIRTRLCLTPREAEVALLLAEGLTNAEVAERLFVSPHTARHHVENVMGKLGVPSRAAVASRLIGAS